MRSPSVLVRCALLLLGLVTALAADADITGPVAGSPFLVSGNGNTTLPGAGSGVTLNVQASTPSTAPAFAQTLSVGATSNGVAAVFYGPTTGAAGFNFDFYDVTNATLRGFMGFGTSTITGDAVTDFGIAPGAGGSVVIGTAGGAGAGTRFGPTGIVTLTQPALLMGYTVAGLPTCNTAAKGGMAYVTDATTPTYNAALTGAGAVIVPVFCNGTAWTSH